MFASLVPYKQLFYNLETVSERDLIYEARNFWSFIIVPFLAIFN